MLGKLGRKMTLEFFWNAKLHSLWVLHNFLWPQQAYIIYVTLNPHVATAKVIATHVLFERKGGIVQKSNSFLNIADWFSFFDFGE